METATFSMGNIVSMEPKKASAGVGLRGPTGGMGARAEGLGLLGLQAKSASRGKPSPLGLRPGGEWACLSGLWRVPRPPPSGRVYAGRALRAQLCCLELLCLTWQHP